MTRADGHACAGGHKIPESDKGYFSARGVQAECIKLNGAMELAPSMGCAGALSIWLKPAQH